MITNIRLTFLFIALFMCFYTSAQDNGTQWGKQEALAKQKFQLYMEFFQFTKNMTKAYPRWHWLFDYAPRSNKRIYNDGPRVVRHEISIEKQQSRRILLEDTLFMIYDNRIKYFGDEGVWLGKKSIEMFRLRLNSHYFEEIYSNASRSVALQDKYSDHRVLPIYYKMSFIQFNRKKISKEKLLEAIAKTNEITSFKINGQTSHKNEYLEARAEVLSLAMQKNAYSSCKDVHAVFLSIFKNNPEDVLLVDSYYEALQSKDCLEDSIFLQVALNKYEREATAELASEIAETYNFFNNKDKAIEYYIKAFEMEEAQNLKVIYAFETAKLYADLKQYEPSRDYLLNAISLNEKFGKAYILLGDIYIKAKNDCDTGKLGASAMLMLAIQTYEKAKSMDATIIKRADKRIDRFSGRLPTSEDLPKNEEEQPIFNAGDNYRIGCWIDEDIKILLKEVEEEVEKIEEGEE